MTIHKIVSVSYIKAGARISTDLEFVTTCSPAMLLTPDDAFAEFRLDDGWIVFDPDITGLEVPIRVTRECIAKHRDGCISEINRCSHSGAGQWSREEIVDAVAELNAEVLRLELQHCGASELTTARVR
jgi:hypothetical protein